MKKEPLILASSSPRRRDLLEELGIDFEVISSTAEEDNTLPLPPAELCQHNAQLKAAEVSARYPKRIVLGADTLVFLEDRALGKPSSMQEAAEMIERLQGRSHSVITGVALLCAETAKAELFHCETTVTFKKLSNGEITHYHSLINPLDKAGAYAAQE